MGFWTSKNDVRSEKISRRIEARGEKRAARVTSRADRTRQQRIENARDGWSGRPLRTRTWKW